MWISIVGSAGRKEDAGLWTREVYNRCFRLLHEELLKDIPVEERKLVSGGAAWADHLAVSLFLGGHAHSLQIEMPAGWCGHDGDFLGQKGPIPGYADTGIVDWKKNPGGTANYYHKQFSTKMGGDSLAGIQKAIDQGATYEDMHWLFGGSSFHNRNKKVAMCELLIAFTWGQGDVPKDGGTKHTWDYSNADKKIHIPLHTMKAT